ncbi:hypothetical protein [Variovorax sp. E3]|uniref:hypothetical protein n=1 Tax=Variovorax sp. E3 TaxID=1914993 RepID=UPI0018DB1FD8|nr:hypothetical protein [Variovorax sp. E3]
MSIKTVLLAVTTAALCGCVAPQVTRAQPAGPDAEVIHKYRIVPTDITKNLLPGVALKYTISKNDGPAGPERDCQINSEGVCEISLYVPLRLFSGGPPYVSSIVYFARKDGFFMAAGRVSSSYGGAVTTAEVAQKRITLYRAPDYLSPGFLNTSTDRELRDQSLKYVGLLRVENELADAELVPGSIGVESFKGKKYLRADIEHQLLFNRRLLTKYDMGKRIFDDTIRKILTPLNDNFSNPKLFHGYDLHVAAVMSNGKEAPVEPIRFRFLMPQDAVKRYKNQDISGQQLLDASILLMDDERIDLKLQ